jgi:Ca2+-binding EF-hand superfamily protein
LDQFELEDDPDKDKTKKEVRDEDSVDELIDWMEEEISGKPRPKKETTTSGTTTDQTDQKIKRREMFKMFGDNQKGLITFDDFMSYIAKKFGYEATK